MLFAGPALGCEAAGEQAGGRLLTQVRSGQLDCDQLSEGDFTAIGEVVMARMIGSAHGHEAMDELMAQTTGEQTRTACTM